MLLLLLCIYFKSTNITSGPAGPSCVRDVGRCSAESLKLTPRQTYPMKDRDIRLCIGDYVRPSTKTAKFGKKSDERWRPHVGVKLRGCVTLFLFFVVVFYRTHAQPKRRVRFERTMAQKTRFREYMCLLGVRIVKKYGAGVKNPQNPQNLARNRDFPC